MVPIFTYRDERKLLALVGAVIAAAAIVLVQLDALRSGKPSPLDVAVTTFGFGAQTAVSIVAGSVRDAASTVAAAPRLAAQNAALRNDNAQLRAENARLREALAAAPAAAAIAQTVAAVPGGIPAHVIGYDPESTQRSIVIDRGGRAGVRADDPVIDADGAVGRVVSVEPFESTVLLLTDGASEIPALVQRGRWWGIATGTNSRIALEYVSQDAKLRVGQRVVTGEGRSFAAGEPVGKIVHVDYPEGALYQTAILQPTVDFGRLTRVVVVARNTPGSATP